MSVLKPSSCAGGRGGGGGGGGNFGRGGGGGGGYGGKAVLMNFTPFVKLNDSHVEDCRAVVNCRVQLRKSVKNVLECQLSDI